MDSPKSDSSTDEMFEAAIFNTNTLLPLLFENGRVLSEPEPQPKRGGSTVHLFSILMSGGKETFLSTLMRPSEFLFFYDGNENVNF
jgi:hypothetical protein